MHKKFALLAYLADRPGWHLREQVIVETRIAEGSVSTYLMELAQCGLAERGKSSTGRTVWRGLVRRLTPAELEALGTAESVP